MFSELEKRAAHLAVARYGANPAQIQRAVKSFRDAQNQGQETDLLDLLLAEKLLTPAQVRELRLALDSTQVDPGSPKNRNGNGNETPVEPTSSEADEFLAPMLRELTGEPLRVVGEYRILRRLGEGGMGAVYLGYHEKDNRQVAIKVLPSQLASNQASVDRFYREAKSGALLNHPHIVRNLAIGQDQATSQHYLVLEYVDGPSAQALLDRFGKLSPGDAAHIVLDIARALEHVHSRNIVHRDIKPANILITQTGVAKLADLGLAKRTDEASHLTAARQGFGTPYYMPYEQAMNAKTADARSDIFALGATLYHLATGEVPFPGSNHLEIVDKKNEGAFPRASSRNPEVSEEMDRILEKMLARQPRDRYQTASELIVDLERSGLAPTVPSFVDADLAMQDPLVRERLTAAVQVTCLDTRQEALGAETPAEETKAEFWFLRYQDRQGQLCKARLTAPQVTQRLREGKLSPKTEASRTPQGEYSPLATFAEFKSALQGTSQVRKNRIGKKVKKTEALPEPKQSLILRFLIGLGVAVLGVSAVVVLWKIFSGT